MAILAAVLGVEAVNLQHAQPTARKTGAGYVRWEDIAQPGDNLITAANRLTSPAVITLPEGVFQFPAHTQGTYYGLIFHGNFKGLSGSGPGTIVQQTPNTISPANIAYSNALTPSQTSNLYAIVTAGSFAGPELSNLHLRGTEQSGILHYPLEWQKATDVVWENVLISGFPGGAPKPPTEVGGPNVNQTTFANGTVVNVTVDGRRYDQATNLPGARVSSSLLMLNTVSAPVNFRRCSFTHGLNQSVAAWHTRNVTFTDCTFEGVINHEESGDITYVRPKILAPAVYHYQTVNDVGKVEFTNPTFAPSRNATPGALFFVHLVAGYRKPRIPIIRPRGLPLPMVVQNPDDTFSTVTSK